MAKYYCKWCGKYFSSIQNMSASKCVKNPEGDYHELYEGSEKSKYQCKRCGKTFPSLSTMAASQCLKNPHHKHHEPME